MNLWKMLLDLEIKYRTESYVKALSDHTKSCEFQARADTCEFLRNTLSDETLNMEIKTRVKVLTKEYK